MRRVSHVPLLALLGTALLAGACERPPADPGVRRPNFWINPANDRMTGGGKLGDGHDFATFGFNAQQGQGELEWVQHCLDGVNPASSTCQFGGFSFHASTVTDYDFEESDPVHCRTWTGSGDVKLRDPVMAARYDGTYTFTVNKACDNGEPGVGTDYMSFTISGYHREGYLSGGNLQLHKS